MFVKLIDFSIKNRLLVILGLVGLLVSSTFMLPKLNLDAFPDVTNIQVQINTEADGLAAKEVEQLITYPIESGMYSLPDVEEVRSISKTGLSVVTVVFKEGTDVYFAREQVFQQLQLASGDIPKEAGVPEIGPNTSGLGQVFQYALLPDDPEKYNVMELRSLNDWFVKLSLLTVPGVTDILSFGGDVKQYQVLFDPSKLLSYRLTGADLQEAIEKNNLNAGGWFLETPNEQIVIRGSGWYASDEQGLQELAQIPVKVIDGKIVRMRDVAKVEYGSEVRQGLVTMSLRKDDKSVQSLGEVVTGIALKRMGDNTKNTIEDIKAKLALIQKSLPSGVKIKTFYDQSTLVDKAVDTVKKALLEAFILILIVLFLFLLNLRMTLLVMFSIPISVLVSLMVMSHYGISANLMSLGGLTIAIGMIVDGSVVMMENIFKHLSSGSNGDHTSGVALRIQEASREIARPVFFAVSIIIVVFAPIFGLEGVEGKLFHPMAQSIVFAMAASLIVALVIMPALSIYVFKKPLKHKKNIPFDWLLGKFNSALSFLICHPLKVVSVTIALFAASLSTLPFLGTEFVPVLEEGTLNIRATLAPSVNLRISRDVAEKLEKKIMEFPEVLSVVSRVGRAEIGGDPEPISNIEFIVELEPITEWTSAKTRVGLEGLMAEKMAVLPGILLSFSQPIATRVDELLSGVKAELAIKLFGADLDVLNDKGKEIEKLVGTIEGTTDVAMEQSSGEPQLIISPRRDIISQYGMNVSDIMSLITNDIRGQAVGQIIKGNERYDIYLRLEEQYRNTLDKIKQLPVLTPTGNQLRLEHLADIKVEAGPPQIRRDDVQRRVVVQLNVKGRDMGSVVKDIQGLLEDKLNLPEGYSLQYGGQFKNQERAQKKLMVIVPVSLLLIFLLLYFAFSSIGHAILIMVNVPLALIGGILALFFSGQYLSVPSSIGFIAVFGIAVLNGVVLVNSIKDNIKNGMETCAGVMDGALSRLRPVLLTAIIASLGLIPMLLSQGVGSEIQRPLATVVVGGIISSTFLTLFVLPVIYNFFYRNKKEPS